MPKSGARLRPGDVLELPCNGGIGLLAYLGRHPWLGDAVWALPEVLPAPPKDLGHAFRERGYVQFYPATAALRDGHIRRLGFHEEAVRLLPNLVRTIVNRDSSGRVRSWLITDGGSTREARDTLSPSEEALPVGVVVNTAQLKQQVETGWTPRSY